jgi:hypothetical protein
MPTPPTKRPFLLPLAAALVTLTVVREGLPKVWDGVSGWVVFIAALVLGYGAYAGTEWFLARRQRQQRERLRQPPDAGPHA